MAKTKNKYLHPFKKGTETLAISDPKAHFGNFKHAIDFLLDYDIQILATAKGIVANVKDDSDKGGLEEKFKGNKYLNYITIKHAKKEYSQYCHIACNGTLVKVGDEVDAGQPIAIGIGINGYTSPIPHLHFMVFRLTDSEEGFESLKVKWKDYKSNIHTGK